MEFPYSFFEDEIRNEFYISGFVKRNWASQMEVLEEIDKVCKKHNIKWFANYGTLLGAVRHKGYIPWDDDLDISMLRPDYMKFLKYAKEELPQGYVVLSCYEENEDYFEYLIRVTNQHGLCFDEEFLDKYHECPYATGIDIFPMDYMTGDEDAEEERRVDLSKLKLLCEKVLPDGSNVKSLEGEIQEAEDKWNYPIDRKRSVKHQLIQMLDQMYACYSEVGGPMVAEMTSWVMKHSYRFPTSCFEEIIRVPYETADMWIPSEYDAILKVEYGDYMKLVKGGGDHEYPCYGEQEEFLISLVPEYPFKYTFLPEDLINQRQKKDSPNQRVKGFVALIEQAHKMVGDTLSNGDFGDAVELLAACQNSAVQIGTLLERYYGEGLNVIHTLEDYCEDLYQASVQISEMGQGEGTSTFAESIENQLHACEKNIKHDVALDVDDKREILFIVEKSSAWSSIEPVWKKANEDSNNRVVVMAVPYYEKTARGAMGKMHYEGDCFPKYVEITDYESYDLAFRHPDVIYIQSPYDQCNYTTTIDPKYYSSKIKKHTEKLIYIPWFDVAEVSTGCEKDKIVMRYYCTVPGLCHADEVLVKTDETRQSYIECLTQFAGKETRQTWENKIKVRDKNE